MDNVKLNGFDFLKKSGYFSSTKPHLYNSAEKRMQFFYEGLDFYARINVPLSSHCELTWSYTIMKPFYEDFHEFESMDFESIISYDELPHWFQGLLEEAKQKLMFRDRVRRFFVD